MKDKLLEELEDHLLVCPCNSLDGKHFLSDGKTTEDLAEWWNVLQELQEIMINKAYEAGKREGLTKSQVEVLLWRPVMHRDKVSEEDVKVILDNINENE